MTYEILQSHNLKIKTCDICLTGNCNVYSLHHFLWLTIHKMVYVKTIANTNHLCMLSIDDSVNCCETTYIIDEPIEHIISSPDACSAYVITDEGVLIHNIGTEVDEEERIIPTDIKWRESCCHVETLKIDSKSFIIAQSYLNCLLIDGEEVANNITSFYVHSDFLLLTTLQNTLICIPLNESGMEQLKKHDLTVKPWEHTDKTLFAGEDFIQSPFLFFLWILFSDVVSNISFLIF